MNKYEEDFYMVTRLSPLDSRERTILNYGIEEGRVKAIDEFAERLKYEHKQTITTESAYIGYSFDEVVDEIAEEMRGAE